MQIRWDVDDANKVELKIGMFRTRLAVNGAELPVKISMTRNESYPFKLADGRDAVITTVPKIGTRALLELRVGGELVMEAPRDAINCGACGKQVKPEDKFCGACGHALPPPGQRQHHQHVRTATRTIGVLAILYLVVGVVIFSWLGDSGTPMGALPRDILIACLIMSAIMGLLAWWSRKAPLPAVLIATAIYATGVAVNLTVGEAKINNFFVLHILIFVFLVRGLKAALALRTANG